MTAHSLARRVGVFSLIVASAALPSGLAYSAPTAPSPAAPQPVTRLFDVREAFRVFDGDLGLPTKPLPLVQVPTTPPVTEAPASTASTAPTSTPDTPADAAPATASAPRAAAPSKQATTKAPATSAPRTTTAPAAPATAPAVAPPALQGSVTSRQDLASAVAAATNAQRVAAGLAPLAYRSCSVPASWALTMASSGSLAHNSLMTILTSCGGTTTAGENIAAGYSSVSAVTAGWMSSPTHRANILNAKFKSISVGVAQAANGTFYWVEDFTG